MSYREAWRRRLIRLGLAILLALIPALLVAQEAPATLTLEEAIELARAYNPDFRVRANDEVAADWQVRSAYAALLPSVNVSSGLTYQASGTPRFGIFSGEDVGIGRTPPSYFSDYSIGLGLTLSGATFFNMAQQRANRAATEAGIDAAAYQLATDVTAQYLAVLRARDNVALAEAALESAEESKRLVDARMAVGEATRLEVTQAEVERGRAEVALVQAENTYASSKLQLMQQIGQPIDREVELTSEFAVFEPTWSLAELQDAALRSHPQLISAQKAEDATVAAARAAKMSYLPTLRFSGGWSGFVRRIGDEQYLLDQARGSAQNAMENCQFWNTVASGLSNPLPGYPQDCSRFTLTPAQERAILSSNDAYPFNYDPNPASFGVDISLPIFNGFQREVDVQNARLAADDAKHRVRAEELARRTQVATQLMALQTAHRTVALEERNVAAATEQLELAQERYRLGAGSILELTQAQENRVRADQAHLAAIYGFHEALAGLEAAVGRRLRP